VRTIPCSRWSRAAGAVALAVVVLLGGCGGGSSSSALTQQQALSITADLFEAMADAPLVAGGTAQVSRLNEAAHIRNASPGEALAIGPGSVTLAHSTLPPVTIPTFTFSCPGGGTIMVSGSFTGSYSATATDAVETVVETIDACTDHGLTFSSDPTINITTTVNLSGDIFADQTTITGGFTAGKNSCSINESISATVNETTQAVSGTISGSVCGLPVSGTI
jgi:hypothetical protein